LPATNRLAIGEGMAKSKIANGGQGWTRIV